MRKILLYPVITAFLVLCSCRPEPAIRIDMQQPAPIYPDYTDIAIPCNIAPLNFGVREHVSEVQVLLQGETTHLQASGKNKIQFSLKSWKKFMQQETGNRVAVHFSMQQGDSLLNYPPFYWQIMPDSIDSYLSYRLIEPGFEVWNHLQLEERNLENFETRLIADNSELDRSCMNCHIYGNNDGSLSLFHIRGKQGGTVLNRNGELRKLQLRNEEFPAGAVYGSIHPSGRYAAFSGNHIIPEFHAHQNKRLEVYDEYSHLLIADFDENRLASIPALTDESKQYTFPAFSADGTQLYFCMAPALELPENIDSLFYSIARINFDAATGMPQGEIEIIWQGSRETGSASHPGLSPDGKYLLFCVAGYGTFPIWHRETDLYLMHLADGEVELPAAVNSDRSDTYHSWSSNSRWFVFASKRDDGLYGKPYFAYIDSTGKTYKPFVLPQKDPEWYDLTLKSYNIPELAGSALPFDRRKLEKVYHQTQSETFK